MRVELRKHQQGFYPLHCTLYVTDGKYEWADLVPLEVADTFPSPLTMETMPEPYLGLATVAFERARKLHEGD